MQKHDPKSAAEHRNRWTKAMLKVWDYRGIIGELSEAMDRPGVHPDYIFDYHDGLRVIASVELLGIGTGQTYLHVSASAVPGSDIFERVRTGKLTVDRFCEMVIGRVKAISGGRRVDLAYVSPGKGIPHFYDPPLPVDLIGD